MKFVYKRSVLLGVVIALLVGMYPGMMFTQGSVQAADPFSGLGNGTIEDPYQIATLGQLNEIRNNMQAHYMLIADIDLGDDHAGNPWTPIGINAPGYASTSFGGTLNGNNKTISNLVVDMPATGSAVGLFHSIAAGGQVEHLSIQAVEVRGNLKVGILAGVNNGIVKDVSVTGSVYGRNRAGAVIGENFGEISQSHAAGFVNGYVYGFDTGGTQNQYIGGLVGYNYGDIASSAVASEVTGRINVGGLVGWNDNYATITDSYTTGDVTGIEYVGGLVGRHNGYATISSSYTTGNVTGVELVGGLVGRHYAYATITDSYTTGDVTGVEDVGGLVGESRAGQIENSFSTGDVSGEAVVGGLVGQNDEGLISGSYATGRVVGTRYVGGLAGQNRDEGEIHGSYATGPVTGEVFVGGLAGWSGYDSVISTSEASGSVIGELYVGGFVGIHDLGGQILNSHATGRVDGTEYVGGLIGLQEKAEVTYSYASGQVEGCKGVGGLVGNNDDALVADSYATGGVTGTCDSALTSDSIGGLVGDNKRGTIENSYAIGLVSGGTHVGGLAGLNYYQTEHTYGSIINSYYDRETSGQSDANGEGKSTEEMKMRATYIGWDFDSIWGIHTLFNDAYPYFGVNQYFLTYIGNGTDHASEQLDRSEYVPGSIVIISDKASDWVKKGYVFKGWQTSADGSGAGYRVGDEISAVRDITLYASWAQPAVPSLQEPADGFLTKINRPTISGTAEPEADVMIMLDGNVVATVRAAADGGWSWIPPVPLDDGLHTVRAGVKDSAGDPASVSLAHTFTVDSIAPVITLVGDALMTLRAGTPFTDPGVTITDAQSDIPVTITGSVDTNKPGVYELQYHAQDRAGNVAVPAKRTVEVIATAQPVPRRDYSPSDQAWLARLTVTTVDGEELAIAPVFSSHTTSYHMETTAAEVTIKAKTSHSAAVATLDKAVLNEGEVIALVKGDNELKIVVTAESGVTKTYTLTIHRLVKDDPAELNPETEPLVCAFRDIAGHWAEALICEAFYSGIVEGSSATMFYPQRYITRVEFAAILLRTLNITAKARGGELVFIDRDRIPAWALEPVSVAVDSGIIQGYPDLSLRPLHMVSRAEMVVMIASALKWEFSAGDTSFADDADIADWAKGYVHGAVERGLLIGREGNRFSPHDPATRAEVTALLLRLRHMLGDVNNLEDTSM